MIKRKISLVWEKLMLTGLFRIMIRSVLICFGFLSPQRSPSWQHMPEFPSAVILYSTLNYLGNEDELHHIPLIQHLFPLNLTPYGFLHRAHHGQTPCEGCGLESVSQGLT